MSVRVVLPGLQLLFHNMTFKLGVSALLAPFPQKTKTKVRREATMTENSQQAPQIDPQDQKEGYVPFIVHKGNHRILMYVQEGMPIFAAFDAALDITVHIREVYRAQVNKAIAEQAKSEGVASKD